MANNRIQVKRTNVSGRTPNTSDPANTQYIAAGELALNMTDAILFTSNGSTVIEVGANNTFQNISTNNLTVGNTLYVVANGNVGISTAAPTAKLEIFDATNPRLKLNNGVYSASFYQDSSYNTTLAMSIQGNISWGTSAAISLLGTNSTTNWIFQDNGFYNTSSSSYIRVGHNGSYGFYTHGSTTDYTAIKSAYDDNNNSGLIFQTKLSGTDAERMRITANGNVGIGTSSPISNRAVTINGTSDYFGVELHVNGGAVGRWLQESTGGVYFDYGAANQAGRFLTIRSGSTDVMRLLANGNVGIGTSSPSDLLAVESQTSNVVARISAGSTASYSATLAMGTTTRDWSLVAGNAAASYSLRLNYVGTDAPVSNIFTASKDGNVGIGTSAPSSRLNVSGGQIRIQSSGTYSEPAVIAGVFAFDSVNGQLSISSRSNGGSTYTSFFTSESGTGAERMRIAANGNIGIGTVSPAQKLHLVGTSGNILIRLDDAVNPRNNYIGVDNYEQVVLAANESNTIGATPYIKFRINASELVRILPSGNFGIGNLSPARKLDVYGSGQFSDASGIQTTIWSQAASGTGGVGTNNNYPFTILSNGGERIRFLTNGDIGINQSTVTGVFGRTVSVTGPNGATFRFAGATVSGYVFSSDGLGYAGISTETNHHLILATNSTERVRVTSSGDVGIGITTPTAKLDVNGSGKFASNTANASIYINNNVEITTNSNNSIVSSTNTIITTFSAANYRGGKFIIMGKRQNDSHMSEVLVTHNNLSAFYNEYGIVYTNNSLYTVSASVVSGNVQIILTSSFDNMNYDIIENRFVHEQTLELDFTNNSYNLLT